MSTIVRSGDSDAWNSEDFENEVAASIIGLYEPSRHMDRSDWPGRVKQEEIDRARENGLYIQHPNRMVFTDELDEPLDGAYRGLFVDCDIHSGRQDDHPVFQHALEHGLKGLYKTYSVLKRAPSIPAPFYPVKAGTAYALIEMSAADSGLETWKEFFTVSGREVHPCAVDGRDRKVAIKRWNYVKTSPWLDGKTYAQQSRERFIMTANTMMDKRHTWTITAHEGKVRCGVGCYHEEVKSLLYARSLPMTATGRKRPILHLVAAHRRRMKEGTDINIDAFLRGVRKVEMGGAIFEVEAPANFAPA